MTIIGCLTGLQDTGCLGEGAVTSSFLVTEAHFSPYLHKMELPETQNMSLRQLPSARWTKHTVQLLTYAQDKKAAPSGLQKVRRGRLPGSGFPVASQK